MNEQINQFLMEKEWRQAIVAIEEELGKPNPEGKDTLTYNLVICYLKIRRVEHAKEIFAKVVNELKPEEQKEITLEIARLEEMAEKREEKKKQKDEKGETVIKEGAIQSLAWFTTTTTFKDVIGLTKAKTELREKIIGPIINPTLYKKWGAKINSGAILHGPPGVGKTLTVKAICGEAHARMLIMRIPEILDRYQGNSERNISALFKQAREKTPSIIFIDEMDALAANRSSINESMAGTIKSIINTLLSEMDPIEKNNEGVFVLGATNREQDVDTAFKRENRFEESIYFGPPNLKDRIALLRFYLKDKKVGHIDYLKLGLLTFGFTPADISHICNTAAKKKAFGESNNEHQNPIITLDMMREIKEQSEPILFQWYAESLEQFKRLPPETVARDKQYKNDIKFWVTKARGRQKIYQAIGAIV